MALGRQIKRGAPGGRCWLGLATGVSSVRPYPGLAALWQMIARSAYLQLRHSPVLLAGTIAGLLWLYALPPAAALAGIVGLALGGGAAAAACAGAAAACWALMTVSFVPMLRLYRLSVLRAPGLPLIAVLYAAMTLDSARRHYAGRGGEWKGRVSPAGRGHRCLDDPAYADEQFLAAAWADELDRGGQSSLNGQRERERLEAGDVDRRRERGQAGRVPPSGGGAVASVGSASTGNRRSQPEPLAHRFLPGAGRGQLGVAQPGPGFHAARFPLGEPAHVGEQVGVRQVSLAVDQDPGDVKSRPEIHVRHGFGAEPRRRPGPHRRPRLSRA